MVDLNYQNTVNNDEGGFLVDETLTAEILKDIAAVSVCEPYLRSYPMPTRTRKINYLTQKPTAYWIGEEAAKKGKSKVKFAQLDMTLKPMAVIVPFAEEWQKFANIEVVQFLREEIRDAFAAKQDRTYLGYEADSPFDTSISGDIPAGNIITAGTGTDLCVDMSNAMGKVEEAGYIPNGWAAPLSLKATLRNLRDLNNQPLFQPANGDAPDTFYGLPIRFSANMTAVGSPAGKEIIVGDWSKAFKGDDADIMFKLLTEATITLDDGSLLNLAEQDMLALRAVIYKAFTVYKADAFAKVIGL